MKKVKGIINYDAIYKNEREFLSELCLRVESLTTEVLIEREERNDELLSLGTEIIKFSVPKITKEEEGVFSLLFKGEKGDVYFSLHPLIGDDQVNIISNDGESLTLSAQKMEEYLSGTLPFLERLRRALNKIY